MLRKSLPCHSLPLFIGLVCLGVLNGPARAAVLRVNAAATGSPSDGATWETAFTTLEDAVAAADGGDSIWVAAGSYPTSVTLKSGIRLYGGFNTAANTLEDRNPNDNPTVLTRSTDGYIFTAGAGVGPDTVVDGFQFRYNGKYSGGFQLADASPTIRANDFSFNIHAIGMALDVRGGAPVVDGNTFRVNTVVAIRAFSSAPVITGNLFQGISNRWNNGGVLQVSGSPVIANNVFRGNNNQFYGGAISGAGSGTIVNNLFVGNTAGEHGGALQWTSSNGTTLIANNSFVGNTAPRGGAISLKDGKYRLSNNLIAFNTSGLSVVSTTTNLDHNCVFENVGGDYDGLADPTGAAGNIRVDPRITSAAYGEAHLQADSPCRAAGDPAAVVGYPTDVDGDPRVVDGAVDIGADQFSGRIYPTAKHIVRVSKSGDDANDGSTWDNAKATVAAALEAITQTGGEVWVAAGIYAERVYLMQYMSLYGGFAGDEQSVEDRVPDNVTTLTGAQAGSVITISTSGDSNVVDGFTLRNGRARYGGGIICTGYGASPLIQGNTLTSNTAVQDADTSVLYNGYGGGIFCDYSTAPRIINNTLLANTARDGGAMYAGSSSVLFERNLVRGNTAFHIGGVRIASGSGSADPAPPASIVRNNVFSYNFSNNYNTCALLVDGWQTVDIVNNTFVQNRGTKDGDTVSIGDTKRALFANNIVTNGWYGLRWFRAEIDIRNNCMYGNTRQDYDILGVYNADADQTGLNGNIRANPLFINAGAQNYQLRDTSPCVNSGDDSVDAGAVDKAGRPRRQGTRIDMGAYETAVPGFTMADAAAALAIAGGLTAPPEVTRFDVEPAIAPDGLIRLEDAAGIARNVAGLN